ncbi:MAG: hypothetical protein AAFV88_10470 [Planctomycetota bacterium]
MMNLDEAIDKLDAMSVIAERANTFNGLRAAPIAITGVIGLATALVQPLFVSAEEASAHRFVLLWALAAFGCLSVVLIDLRLRYLRESTRRKQRLTLQVLGKLAPSIVTGAAIAFIVLQHSPELAWTLPSWWAILLGMGICSCSSLLPHRLLAVGAYYIGTGLLALLIAKGDWSLHPLAMAIPFVGGQFLTAWLIGRDDQLAA